jgi:hypothetical protein
MQLALDVCGLPPSEAMAFLIILKNYKKNIITSL